MLIPINELLSDRITGEWGNDPSPEKFVNVLRTTNFTNEGKLNFSKVVKRDIDEAKIKKKKLVYGDTIIEKSGGSPKQPVGRVVYFDLDTGTYLCNNFTTILRPSTKVIPKYLFYCLFYLHKTKRTLGYQNKTTGIINLQLDRYLKSESVWAPELSVQDEIVKSLDIADALIIKRREAIELLDDYIKSVFLELFGDPILNPLGWDVAALGTNATIKIGPFGSLLHKSDYVQGGIPLVNPKHMIKSRIKVDPKNTISKEKHAELRAYHLKENDVVLARRGDIGRCGYVTVAEDGFLCGTGSMIVRPEKTSLSSMYLIHLISTPQMTSKLLSKAKGITMKNLNAGSVQSLEIPVPPIERQKRFEEILERTEQVKNQMTLQLIELDNQFNSLIQKALKGSI